MCILQPAGTTRARAPAAASAGAGPSDDDEVGAPGEASPPLVPRVQAGRRDPGAGRAGDAGVSIQLERSQREGLLRAKELSASAVTRLFADSCAPSVVFDDPADLHETLVTLGRNEDVEYVAVWAVDATGQHHAPACPSSRAGAPKR